MCFMAGSKHSDGRRKVAHSRRWKEKVWLIIEDGGIYEMVAGEKGYLK